MSNKHLLFFCLLLTGLQAAAQQTFSGFFISTGGDTTAVTFPGYNQWKNNPAKIEVRTAGGQEMVLTPENSREVTIEGYDTYRSRRFTRLTNPYLNTDFAYLSATDSTEEINGFLLFVARGAGISLYKYSDHKRINFFIENADSLVELKHKLHLGEYNDKIVEDNRFRQQLWTAFISDGVSGPAMKHRLENLAYKEDQLAAFVEGVTRHREKKKKRYPSNLVVLGGVAYNTYDVASKSYSNNSTKADYNTHMGPVLGVAYYDYSQRNFGRNFFTLQLKYYNFKHTGTFTNFMGENTVTFSGSLLNLGIGLGRNLVQSRALTAYAAVVPTMVYMPNSIEKYSYDNEENKISVISYNFSLQAGLRLPNRLGVWVHYNLLPIDTRRYVYYRNEHRSVQLGVDWQLKRN